MKPDWMTERTLLKTGKPTAAQRKRTAQERADFSGPCEWCGTLDRPTERDHVAQGIHRKASDAYDELVLDVCRPCHDCRHAQKDKRQIGLALLVRAGRGTVETICELYYRVTGRRFPPVEEVKAWVKRIGE